jgi:hypothetical protein
MTLETQGLFSSVTASIPAVAVSFVIHLALTPLLNSAKSGRGGYELPTELESAK